ncbi:MAG TPA: hypothetical protein VMJ70_05790 [Candidatus Sulfotelmatobacter sp.]|nr:hypothetical protein [Candidatus Sulfotelmatobacter sp.]
MRLLMRWHRYLSLSVAPAMLFFAVSGAWQSFRLHESRKDGSYHAPAVLERLSVLHKAERLRGPAGNVFRLGELAIALVFASTALLGIVLGFKLGKHGRAPWVAVSAGIVLPFLIAWIGYSGSKGAGGESGGPPPGAHAMADSNEAGRP